MISRWAAAAITVLASSSVASCKTFPSEDMAPAALVAADQTSMTALKAAAAKVLGRKTVELGANDFANSSAVSVLPERAFKNGPPGAPFNQEDFMIPTTLLIMTDGSDCYLIKEDTRDWAPVEGVDCRALEATQR